MSDRSISPTPQIQNPSPTSFHSDTHYGRRDLNWNCERHGNPSHDDNVFLAAKNAAHRRRMRNFTRKKRNIRQRPGILRNRSSSLQQVDGLIPPADRLIAELTAPLEARFKHCLPDLDFIALVETLRDDQLLQLTDIRNHAEIDACGDEICDPTLDYQIGRDEAELVIRSIAASRRSSVQFDPDDEIAISIQPECDYESKNFNQEYRRTFAKETMTMANTNNLDTNLNDAYQQIKINTKSKWKYFYSLCYEYLDLLVVWRSSFKEIEGAHGSQATCYFSVLRWLMFLNTFVAALIICCLVLPQTLLPVAPLHFSLLANHTSSFTQLNHYEEAVVNCSMDYKTSYARRKDLNFGPIIIQFLKGTGWMEETSLFTGNYYNRKLDLSAEVLGSLGTSSLEVQNYDIGLAFLLVTGFYFFITLISMIVYTGDGFKNRHVHNRSKVTAYSHIVFTSWDFSVTSSFAAKVNNVNINRKIVDAIALQRERKLKSERTICARFKIYTIRVVSNTTVLFIWTLSSYVIYGVFSAWVPKMQTWPDILREYLPPLTITLVNALLPTLFEIIAKFESLSADTEIEITIARAVILRIASLIVLVVSLRKQIVDCEKKVCGNCSPILCWETYVGQQFYRLVLMDTFAMLAITCFEFFRKNFIENQKKRFSILRIIPEQNFNLPKNVLDLIYCQTLSWIGGFFSPLIPFITVMKLLLMFYMKKLTILKNCTPYANRNRTSRTNSFFMMLLLLSFVFCVVVVAYTIGRIPPSQSCGPWRVYTTDKYFIYQAASDALLDTPPFIRATVRFLFSWTFYAPTIACTGFIVAYNTSMLSKYKAMIIMLREQNEKVEKDKIYLLHQINLVMKKID